MFRSLHMKLVLIMVLLIVSLMTVVGAFLTNSVSAFYREDFYDQMRKVFNEESETLAMELQRAPEEGQTDVEVIQEVLKGYIGALGVDNRNRSYYILDGVTGTCLANSGEQNTADLAVTNNVTRALLQEPGYQVDVSSNTMDAAVPITRGENQYIIYILDNGTTVRSLNAQLFQLILEALGFGLVISILLSFLMAKTMITPIERLTAGAERVAKGDFSHKIEVASRDEIGVLTGTFNDMAGQLRATLRAVENERNKLGTLFLHMTDGVVAFSREGEVIQCNPAAERMLGRRIAEGGGEDYESLFGDIAALPSVLAVEQPGYLDGTRQIGETSLELLLAPFDKESAGGVMVVIHDVTEQHKTEEMRREFVANVSHELRTPLTNIRSYAETLVDNAGALPANTERDFLGVILNESDRMTHIVQDLLTLSRFDSGHSALKLERFSFGRAIRDVYNAVALDAQRHGHKLSMAVEEGLPEIVGDRERVLQVMMNIVSNAIKYTPDGGIIAISGGRDGERVWMEVSDNGIGIPAQDRARICERCSRVDKARSRESGGTGLGLAIAKEIVDRHEGELRLVDKREPGLTIRVELKIEGPSHDEA